MRNCALLGASVRASLRQQCKLNYQPPSLWRSLSSATDFAAQVAEKKAQIYISKVDDPCINLSIEHYLLQKSRKDSVILFLYINRPSVVIGRNQNPWLEIDLKLIGKSTGAPKYVKFLHKWSTSHQKFGEKVTNRAATIDLVRRRSGGGSVFHDQGNVNYCVICPSGEFTRDKHAEMVVRAIRDGMNPRARVNERHDIVLDQAKQAGDEVDPEDMHRTRYADPKRAPLKISGSAYKMVKDRVLHHGTCLLNSANMAVIGRIFKSPARPYIKALGVESVRSPVGVIFPDWEQHAVEKFQNNVIKQFRALYGIKSKPATAIEGGLNDYADPVKLDKAHTDIPEIQKGIEELRSDDWTYGQTPRFTFDSCAIPAAGRSSVATENVAATIWPSTFAFPKPAVNFSVRQGLLEEATINSQPQDKLIGKRLHEIDNFEDRLTLSMCLHNGLYVTTQLRQYVVKWLNATFAKDAKR